MIAYFAICFLFGLLDTVGSTTLYPHTAQRPPDLLHDFQKGNISTSWAPGYPKEWSDNKSVAYHFSDGGPYQYTSGAIPVASLSSDEKLLVTLNASRHISVIDFATGTKISHRTLTTTHATDSVALRILTSPSGYDILVSISYFEVQRLRLSPPGIPTGNVTIYPGGLLFDKGSPSTSHNERYFTTAIPNAGQYHIHDLDDPDANVTIQNHTDDYYDVSFTPDDRHVVARSWSYSGMPGSTKMFDVATGMLVHDFNDTESETLSVSPDGNLLATSLNAEAVQIWLLHNISAQPITLALPARIRAGGFQRFAWSPDSKLLAAGTYNNLVIWKLDPSPEIIQWLQLDSSYTRDVSGLQWLGTSRIAYRVFGGLELYDFETNLKYRWGFDPYSHWVDGAYVVSSTIWAKGKAWIGGVDADFQVRFWEVPA